MGEVIAMRRVQASEHTTDSHYTNSTCACSSPHLCTINFLIRDEQYCTLIDRWVIREVSRGWLPLQGCVCANIQVQALKHAAHIRTCSLKNTHTRARLHTAHIEHLQNSLSHNHSIYHLVIIHRHGIYFTVMHTQPHIISFHFVCRCSFFFFLRFPFFFGTDLVLVFVSLGIVFTFSCMPWHFFFSLQ